MSNRKLPENWIKCFSKTRKLDYYFNIKTQKSVWTVDEIIQQENSKTRNSNELLQLNSEAFSFHNDQKVENTACTSNPRIPKEIQKDNEKEKAKIRDNTKHKTLKSNIFKSKKMKKSQLEKIVLKVDKNNLMDFEQCNSQLEKFDDLEEMEIDTLENVS